MQRRPCGLALIALFVVLLAVRQPTTDIRINLHDAGDPTPRQIIAAVDTGLMAVSVLVTWSRRIAQ
ncbi:hypothetical protein [Sphingomonas sp. 37zxx]|uniref:hypothetical protein n=1 Tax=Sphingomonas sp. 37zxx TaxID=1550073 RepID=UPI00053BED59|nr:hypothetical protein [Sphingomonas sp. 37zxx]